MVNTSKLKLTVLQEDILKVLFKRTGNVLNQRQLANALNVSPPAVLKSLPLLEKLNYILVKKDRETRRLSIELNKSFPRVMQLKRADNLKQIYESGLADYLEDTYAGAAIILFGSYSRGDDLINSDIDIAVIGRKEKELDLKNYEKKLERKININYYDSFEKIHKNLKENLANGIVLAGGFQL
ncbi:MAG: nucleotidyltransferase domain-containing protein [Candidatus Nanoarchaeia archaeon]